MCVCVFVCWQVDLRAQQCCEGIEKLSEADMAKMHDQQTSRLESELQLVQNALEVSNEVMQ